MINIVIRNNVGDTYGITKERNDFIRNIVGINYIDNVYYNYNFTQTTSPTPDLCNISIFGLDNSIKNIIHSIGDKVIGKDFISKPLMQWEPSKKERKDGILGEYKYKVPMINLVLDETGKKGKKLDPIEWKYQEYGWSMIDIYNDDTLIYSGDIIKITDTIDTIDIEAGTQYYFLNLLFSERIYMADEDEIIYYQQYKYNDKIKNVSDFIIAKYNNIRLIQWSSETYANIFKKIVNAWTIDNPYYNEASLMDITKDYELNDVAIKALEKYKTGKDVKDLELSWDIIQYKRLTKDEKVLKKENGEKLQTNEHYTLSGVITNIMQDIADKGFMTLYCYNNTFYVNSYWVTHNPKDEILLQSYASPNESYLHMPVGDLTITDDGRGVFTSSLKMLLMPSTGVTIYRDPDTEDVDLYVDTVEVSGNQDSATVTYSGRTKDFLFYDEV